MATFFGEVILPSSRAFFDDADVSDSESGDNESFSESICVNTVDKASLECSYDVLVMTDGTVAQDFVENYVYSDKKLVCELVVRPESQLHIETEMIYSKKLTVKPSVVASLYRSKTSLYLETSPSLQLRHANLLTTHIIPWIKKCEEVLILASRPLSEYKQDMCDSAPQTFVRYLTTSHAKTDLPHASRLHQPNFISGPAASVMSWCEVNRVKGLLLVCYCDCLFSDSASLQPLLLSLASTKYSQLVRNTSSARCSNPTHLNVMYQ